MFWSVVTGALIMLMGILIGAAIATPKKDSFQLLLEELKKMNEATITASGIRRKECQLCGHAILGRNLAQLDEEFVNHFRSKHPGQPLSAERPAREIPPSLN